MVDLLFSLLFLGNEDCIAGVLPDCGYGSLCPFVSERPGQRLQTASFAQDLPERLSEKIA